MNNYMHIREEDARGMSTGPSRQILRTGAAWTEPPTCLLANTTNPV
eukprot:CAMPEP_0185195804 /NCGR_PEP_ID=MMETSP1140-20130426/35831_1 /TAXON_ID=298111 /ORGANISM="Pavlova sp., Strain CCMP459" /LENGTH=45 /DNA_ID= /DNA_START= /DNA_END= /DNA_ORIENTATION=